MPVETNKAEQGRPSPRSKAALQHLSEPALLERARAREGGAFAEFVARTEAQLYRVAMRVVRNDSDAQEILQESYLSAWRSLPRFEGRSQFGSWMHRIVVNHSLMHLRAQSRHPEVATHAIDHLELDEAIASVMYASLAREDRPDRPDRQLQSAELLELVEGAVNALPEKLRAAFLLREVSDVSTVDMAATLGVTTPAVKTRIHRARKVLRESLEGYALHD